MSIATNLQKLETDITNAYSAINTKGGTIPSDKNTNNLATAINSISGGSATLITKSITQNGTYNASSDNADGYSQVTVNVEGGGTVEPEEKDVNFYDYDGTRVYSYTKNEFLELNDMPENPTHTGLTAQGWNWSLSDAQTYVTNNTELDIGQNYVTSDGATRLYIKLIDSTLKLQVKFGVYANSTNTIDWGDNTTPTTVTSSSKKVITANHVYSTKGEYVISIKSSKNKIYITGQANSGSSLISGYGGSTLGTSYANKPFNNVIKKIELGTIDYYDTDQYSFNSLGSLETITMPLNAISSNVSHIGFSGCSNLKCVIIPYSIVEISSTGFTGLRGMKVCCLPKQNVFNNNSLDGCWILRRIPIHNCSIIPAYCFEFSYCADKIKFGSNITTINNYAFYASSINTYDFTNNTSVPTLSNVNAFSGGATDYKILVPSSLYNTWISSSNWSSISSHIESV